MMPQGQRYRLEIEHSKTVLVDCHWALSYKKQQQKKIPFIIDDDKITATRNTHTYIIYI